MKKVYFACSISGGRDHAHLYQDIVTAIKTNKVEVLSELFADPTLTAEFGPTKDLTPQEIWAHDWAWVQQADAIIAEVTQPSLGVGYELGKAEDLGKPILALFYLGSGRRLSPMISGNPSIAVREYTTLSEVQEAIADFLSKR